MGCEKVRSGIAQSNILPACALVFLFYLGFTSLINAVYPPHAGVAAALLSISLFAEHRLLSAMLLHVYDKYFIRFRNALAFFMVACCVFFIARGSRAVLPLAYTIFAALPFITTSTRRRKRDDAARRACDPSKEAVPADNAGHLRTTDKAATTLAYRTARKGVSERRDAPLGSQSACVPFSVDRQLELDREVAYLRYAMPIEEHPDESRTPAASVRR